MKREFFDIYERLYDEYIYTNVLTYRRPLPRDKGYYEDMLRYERRTEYSRHEGYYIAEYEAVAAVKNSIDRADMEYNLRPDAKYFLLVNFHHLIVRPLFEQIFFREGYFDRFSFREIEDRIQYDISIIVTETKKESPKEKIKISGHQIMRTIDRLWKNLKTTRLEIWGEDE